MNSQAIAPTKQATRNTPTRFQRLWAEAEAAAQENELLHCELDSLVRLVGTEVDTAENALGESVRQALHRQLDFSEKKSLLKWQRAELSAWIDEYLSQLMELGQLDEPLQNRLAVMRARELDVELDTNSDLSPVEQLRTYLDQLASNEDEQSENQRGYDGFDEDEEMPVSDADYQNDEQMEEMLRRLHEQFSDQEYAPPESDVNADHTTASLDDAVFKRLFRQTAAALHPDREVDPDNQQVKHELMSELLQARKERDLITVLRLHRQHASADSELTATDELQLEEVLVTYLGQQRNRMDEIVHRSPMHRWVFQEFYHKNPATVKRRIKSYVREIDIRREKLDLFVNRVKTLKLLKELLAERYEQHRFGGGWF
ncbi:MAG: hypothetical protein AB8B87_07735 [Granulosicoccus sp.]